MSVPDWDRYLRCPTCLALQGEPCLALSGRVEGGRPDGVAVALEVAHYRRKVSRRVKSTTEER